MRKKLWLCFDLSNGDGRQRHPQARHYTWWFDSREEARRKMREHRGNKEYALLAGPFKFVRG